MASPLRPRASHLILLSLLVCGGLFYFYSSRQLFYAAQSTYHSLRDPGLPKRLAKSEEIYQRMLKGRGALLSKFGPSPDNVVMFPPDKDPWPAYVAWDFFPPAFNCPHERERIGNMGDGGKWVCGLSRLEDKPDCTIYSFGVSGGSSYEAEILTRTKYCRIWGYDHNSRGFGGEIPRLDKLRTHFKRYQLSSKDSHGRADDPKMWTLKSLMEANGHSHIDILKIDVESSEFAAVEAFLKPYLSPNTTSRTPPPLPVGQLQIELHTWGKSFPDLYHWWEQLEQVGLRPFMKEANLIYTNYNRDRDQDLTEYSFINIKGSNIFIVDPPPMELSVEETIPIPLD